jgi:predicted Zn finger-like uncharacterized protein
MLITCHNCATSYEVEPSSLGPTGRSVRCARCGQVWFAANTAALAEIADEHRAEVAAFTGADGTDGLPDGGALAASDPSGTEPDWNSPEGGGNGSSDGSLDTSLDASLAADAGQPPEDPVTIEDAPTLAPTDAPEAATTEIPGPEHIESVATRRLRNRKKRRGAWPMPGIGTAILALVAVNMALLAWRTDVVRAMPQTASLYAAIGLPVNLRGLTFNNLTTTVEAQDGVQVLVVDGTIINATSRMIEVPRLRFSVRNEKGGEVYTWTAQPPKALLAPGEALPFRSRLASPPRDAHQVLVRFFNRRDLASGVQ